MDFSVESLPKPLRLLHDYWQEKRGDRLMPSRSDINPVHMRDFLPHTMLLDVLCDGDDEPQFRVRLAGTNIVDGYGSEVTGKLSTELALGDQAESLTEVCRYSVNTRKPAYLKGKFKLPDGEDYVIFERLGVPLSSDGENVNILLIAAIVQRKQRAG
ncbi:MAG: PAS domain-containing protein [Pseudomonadota bacterium]